MQYPTYKFYWTFTATLFLIFSTSVANFAFAQRGGEAAPTVSEKGPKPALAQIVDIYAGGSYGLALSSNGEVFQWGRTDCSFPYETFDSFPIKIDFPAGVTITQIAAGGDHRLALDSDGTIWSWGCNNRGQLGIGSVDDFAYRPFPQPVGPPADYISAGSSQSFGINQGGILFAWGWNHDGQLGFPHPSPYSDQASPFQVNFLPTAEVASGFDFSLFRTTDNRLYSVGEGRDGALGLGDYSDREGNPTPVNLSQVSAIAAGSGHSAAIRGGEVYVWGNNFAIGGSPLDGHTLRPIERGGFRNAVQVEASTRATFVRVQDPSSFYQVYAIGSHRNGETGLGLLSGYSNTFAPLTIPSSEDVIDISANGDMGLALTEDGKVYCWGGNRYFSCSQPGGPVSTPAEILGFTSTGGPPVSFFSEALGSEPPVHLEVTNYPNPFVHQTRFSVTVPESGSFTLEVFDVSGRKVSTVLDGILEEGEHSV
ncbi:MAG: hypothetical protein AAFU38_13460, partial [Bacteroidota bacterium]